MNAGLDVLYITGGLAVAAGRGRHDPAARGHGLAAVVQGVFLLGFDAWHAARVPEVASTLSESSESRLPGPGSNPP